MGKDDPVEAALHRVLRERDPEGLIGFGAPPDEYSPEVRRFVELAGQNRTITADVLVEVWTHFFSETSSLLRRASREDLESLADRLETAIRRHSDAG